ncbi:proline-rich protein 19 [Coturnix japonica]|uniref:proline-rich protein 19 n=1 Tax=Coturnix japonica TaxID=93934 RepID=UPI0007774850|nr:proline-rich protein 19 [Coturnix japonica]
MSQQRGRVDAGDAVRELQAGPGRLKRRKTRGERNRAKFGPSLRGSRWRGGRNPWGGLAPPRPAQPLHSPLPPPRPVIITQRRLCRPRGLLGRGVASMDIKRLLEGGQGAEPPPPPPAEDILPESPRPVKGMEKDGQRSPSPPDNPADKAAGDRQSLGTVSSARGLAARLCALLPQPPEFWGRVLAEERRRALLAILLEHHRTLPDLDTLLPHKSTGTAGGLSHTQPPVPSPASHPPPGLSTAETELLPQPMQSRDTALHHSHPPTPPQVVTQSPTSLSQISPPVFSTETKKRQSLFPWMSEDEDEDDAHPENPAPQFWDRTPPPPFRPTPPACSPISHPRVRHCTPELELPPQPRQRPHYCRCRAPLQADAQTPRPPAVLPPPVFGVQRRERQSWFPLMPEDEDDTHPENSAPFWVRTPSPPLFRGRTPPRIPLREPGCTCGVTWDPRAGDAVEGHGQIHQRSCVPQRHRVSQHPLSVLQTPPQPHQCRGTRQTLPALHRGACHCAPSPPHHPHKHSPCPHSWPHPTSDLPMCHCLPSTSYRPQGCRGPTESRCRGWHLPCCPRGTAPHRAGDGDCSPNARFFPCMY